MNFSRVRALLEAACHALAEAEEHAAAAHVGHALDLAAARFGPDPRPTGRDG